MNPDMKGERRPPARGWLVLLALALGLGALVWLGGEVPEGRGPSFVYLVLLLVFLGTGLVWYLRRAPVARGLRHAALWLAVFGLAFVGYSFRDEARQVLDRVRGDLVPRAGFGADEREISFRAGRTGHFLVEARVEGVPITFLVDTGASDVVLSREDARRLGRDPERLVYSRAYRTANGVVMGAPVTLDEVAIGPVVLERVRASVNDTPMEASLLGMSYLGRIGGYRVSGDRLTLYAP